MFLRWISTTSGPSNRVREAPRYIADRISSLLTPSPFALLFRRHHERASRKCSLRRQANSHDSFDAILEGEPPPCLPGVCDPLKPHFFFFRFPELQQRLLGRRLSPSQGIHRGYRRQALRILSSWVVQRFGQVSFISPSIIASRLFFDSPPSLCHNRGVVFKLLEELHLDAQETLALFRELDDAVYTQNDHYLASCETLTSSLRPTPQR